MDWKRLEGAAQALSGSTPVPDGRTRARTRARVAEAMQEARIGVAETSGLPTFPDCQLLLVDRKAWIAGNVRSLARQFGELPSIPGPVSAVVSVEAGAVMAFASRAVMAQYDPFRDVILVVEPNLGRVKHPEFIRWLAYHEVTHLAQFRAAPWIANEITEAGQKMLGTLDPEKLKKRTKDPVGDILKIVGWVKDTITGDGDAEPPSISLLPLEMLEVVRRVNSMMTVLEGHATHICDLVARQRLEDTDGIEAVLAQRRARVGSVTRIIESLTGLEMKRRQYQIGQKFVREIFENGGPEALGPFFDSPENIPTTTELAEPELWLKRVG